MGMTLEGTIVYADKQAEWMSKYSDVGDYESRAEYYRQLAEWLRELRSYKENREGRCNWCSNLKNRHLRIEYYWIDDEGNTASYVGKTNQVATGIARFCPCCGRFIEREVNADDKK